MANNIRDTEGNMIEIPVDDSVCDDSTNRRTRRAKRPRCCGKPKYCDK